MPAETLRPHGKGVAVCVKAVPSSGRVGLKRLKDGSLRLELKSAAEKGKANREAEGLLSRFFKAEVRLLSGGARRRKEFLLEGVDMETARAIIEKHLGRSRK